MNFRDRGLVRRRGVQTMLDITPLIDVVFLLLIFFLLTATFVTNPAVPVDLPKASTSMTRRVRRDLVVTILRTGELEFQGHILDMDELFLRLQSAAKKNSSAKLLIRADSQAVVGRMVQVMDAARKAGLRRFGLATRPKGREK